MRKTERQKKNEPDTLLVKIWAAAVRVERAKGQRELKVYQASLSRKKKLPRASTSKKPHIIRI